MTPFTIGYLQVGPPAHGICRYGRLLAAEGRCRPDLAIMQEDLELDGDAARDRRRLEVAASRLSAADVVHLQVSLWGAGTWGAGSRALRNLEVFRRACRAPVVCTLHDVTALLPFENERPLGVARRALVEVGKGLLRPLIRWLRRRGRPAEPTAPAAPRWNLGGFRSWRLTRWIIERSSLTFVITEAEQRLLASMGLSRKTALVPHFVEDAPSCAESPPPSPASRKMVIVAGFLFEAKGHQLMVEAMPHLPDVDVVFVGGPSVGAEPSDDVSRLIRLADELGVLKRLRLTGYLPEDEYQRYLARADLAVCPFGLRKGASGSLSSLIAAGCPILASDIQLIREYNALVPDAIATFSPYTAAALAAAVRHLLARPRAELDAGLQQLRQRLSIHALYDRHLAGYRLAARDPARRGT